MEIIKDSKTYDELFSISHVQDQVRTNIFNHPCLYFRNEYVRNRVMHKIQEFELIIDNRR